jgi:hypothetical protein
MNYLSIVILSLAAAGTAAQESPSGRATVPASATQTSNGPREFLRGKGLDDEFWSKFRDGRPIDAEEQEPLLRILYWLRRFDSSEVGRWIQLWGKAPQQGEMFRLSSRLRSLQRLEPSPELAERFGLPQYYRGEVLLEPGGRPAVFFAGKVPRAWPEGGKTGARIGAEAMFLKYVSPISSLPKGEGQGVRAELLKNSPHPNPLPKGEGTNFNPHTKGEGTNSNPLPKGEGTLGNTLPVFAAERLAWYPPTPLGDLGFDYGLFDGVEQNQPNLRQEREAFYSMLAAVGLAKPGAILAAAGKIPLRFNPKKHLGQPFVVKGTARNVEIIRLGEGDRDIIERFHLDHYYQIMLYTGESGDIPITACVRQLPPGLPEGSGPDYSETLQVAGFFYKVWRYKISSDRPTAGASAPTWFSPLLIGREPIWYPPPKPPEKTMTTLIVGVVFAVLFAAICVIAWRMNRRDRRFFQSLKDKDRRQEPPPTI